MNVFDTGRELIVEHLKDGAEATVGDIGLQGGIGPLEFVFSAGFEGFAKYCVSIMIMDNH